MLLMRCWSVAKVLKPVIIRFIAFGFCHFAFFSFLELATHTYMQHVSFSTHCHFFFVCHVLHFVTLKPTTADRVCACSTAHIRQQAVSRTPPRAVPGCYALNSALMLSLAQFFSLSASLILSLHATTFFYGCYFSVACTLQLATVPQTVSIIIILLAAVALHHIASIGIMPPNVTCCYLLYNCMHATSVCVCVYCARCCTNQQVRHTVTAAGGAPISTHLCHKARALFAICCCECWFFVFTPAIFVVVVMRNLQHAYFLPQTY